jgi:hypothetical protein
VLVREEARVHLAVIPRARVESPPFLADVHQFPRAPGSFSNRLVVFTNWQLRNMNRVRRHFASKRNKAKRKRNFVRFDAKKSAFFACFASMRNVEICRETKMERSENKTKKKQKTAIIFASKRNEAKRKQKTAIIFASKRNGSEFFSLRCKK